MNQLREEILISKAVGGDATPQEWDELTEMALHAPDLWLRLAGCLRDERALDRALDDAGSLAEAIELPALGLAMGIRGEGDSPLRGQSPGQSPALRGAGRWLGWAVAAAIALSWVTGTFQPNRLGVQPDDASRAGVLSSVPVDDLLQAYLDRGRQEQRVIGELPDRVLVNTRPAAAGNGYELLYVRQIFEREVVPELYRPGAQDELGRTTLVRCQAPQRPPM
jgi:hypothetical protein